MSLNQEARLVVLDIADGIDRINLPVFHLVLLLVVLHIADGV